MTFLLPLFQPGPTQVLPLFAIVFPEFTSKRQTHHPRNKRMANGVPLNQPDKLLEITLQDSLDGLEDFTLQMACSVTGSQFEILSIDHTTENESENNLSTKPTPLTLVSTSTNNLQPTIRRHRRI